MITLFDIIGRLLATAAYMILLSLVIKRQWKALRWFTDPNYRCRATLEYAINTAGMYLWGLILYGEFRVLERMHIGFFEWAGGLAWSAAVAYVGTIACLFLARQTAFVVISTLASTSVWMHNALDQKEPHLP